MYIESPIYDRLVHHVISELAPMEANIYTYEFASIITKRSKVYNST